MLIDLVYFFKYLPPQRIARIFGRLGYLVFRAIYLRTTTEDIRFPDYYYQLAAATAYTGKGDTLVSSFLHFSRDGELWWTRPCLSSIMNELNQLPLTILWGTHDDLLPSILGVLLHRIRPCTDIYFIKNGLHNPAHTNAHSTSDAILHAIYKYQQKLHLPMMQSIAEANVLTNSLQHVHSFITIPKDSSGLGNYLEQFLITEQILISNKERNLGNNNSYTIHNRANNIIRTTDNEYPLLSTSKLSRSIIPLYGIGRRYCQNCHYRVTLHKAYWYCHCAVWTYNSHIYFKRTQQHFQYFLQFMDELYIYGTFNARTSKSIIKKIPKGSNNVITLTKVELESEEEEKDEDNSIIRNTSGIITTVSQNILQNIGGGTEITPSIQLGGTIDKSIIRGNVYLVE